MSEAAFMTGLERNAEVVVMTSYAPLMAHAEGWQWTPDMIWFNNLQAYGTANYYVQKLYSTNRGTDLLSITKDGKAVTGQNDLFASAVRDDDNGTVIFKLVNTSAQSQEVDIQFSGARLDQDGVALILKSDHFDDINSFESPMKISPKEKPVLAGKKMVNVTLDPHSFTVLRFKLK